MQVEVYPLAEAGNPPPTVYTDAWDVLFDATIRYDASFFQNLNRIVQSEPWLERERLMIDYLRSIRIEKGQPFAPDAGMPALLDAAAQTARAWLEARYDAFYPGFFIPEGQWTFPVPAELVQALQNGYSDPGACPVDLRGVTFTFAYVAIKRLGANQFYLVSIHDADGSALLRPHGCRGRRDRALLPSPHADGDRPADRHSGQSRHPLLDGRGGP